MPFLTKIEGVTLADSSGEVRVHDKDVVLSDWEVSDFIKEQIEAREDRYTRMLEPLNDREAHEYRVKATENEGPRQVLGEDGLEVINPPFDDYVGLHPAEIIARMRTADLAKVHQVKLYERGGFNRLEIVGFTAPCEREPFAGYEDVSIRDLLEKMGQLSDQQIEAIIVYEKNHRARPAITSYERESYESETSATAAPSPANAEGGDSG